MGNEATVNPLNAELNPICHLLALLGAHHIFHVSGLRVNVAEVNFIDGDIAKWAFIVEKPVGKSRVSHYKTKVVNDFLGY